MASTYLTKTFGSSGSQQTATFSVWVKRSALGGGGGSLFGYDVDGSNFLRIGFKGNDQLAFRNYNGGTYTWQLETNRLFRDTSAWYHIVFEVDSTQATSSDRLKLYVNGVQETSFLTATYPSQNANMKWGNNAYAHIIGDATGGDIFDGIMSHINVIDGTAYDASAFGEYDANGVWKIKTSPSVTYGTNGFFILKDGNSVTDQSGNGNNFTVAGGTLTNTEDSPSNVFCTNNSLWKQESTRYLTHTLGNTMISGGGSVTWYQTPGTLAFNSGKFYWECKWNSATNLTQNHAGVIDYDKTMETGLFRSKTGSVFFTNEDGGETWIDGSNSSADYGTLAQNDILGVAVDMDAATPTVKFYKNGSLHLTANAASLAGKFVTPAQMIYQSGQLQLNFGNGYFGTTAVSSAGTNASGIGIFEYDVPTGYTALSTKGLNL